MGDFVKKYTCGSCKYYEYAGQYTKGYCSYYNDHYHHDESCDHWEESDSYSSGSSGCFLTTACCEYKGLQDDCYELEKMRYLRDQYILKQEYGKDMMMLYYNEAPQIVERINKLENRNEILESIYKTVCEISDRVEQEAYDEAVIMYMMMFTKLLSDT